MNVATNADGLITQLGAQRVERLCVGFGDQGSRVPVWRPSGGGGFVNVATNADRLIAQVLAGEFLIEDGKLAAGLVTGRFTESVLGALARTDGIGDRIVSQPVPNVWSGCVSVSAIRVRGFRFGGRPEGVRL